MFHVPEKYRIKNHPIAMLNSDESFGNRGAFEIKMNATTTAFVIASNKLNWEHVSVSIIEDNEKLMPTWDEMCFIKNLFWDEEDCVIQYHPPKSQYVNNDINVLHLWRPIGIEIPLPPSILVGIKSQNQ